MSLCSSEPVYAADQQPRKQFESHRGHKKSQFRDGIESTKYPDSAEATELRKAAYEASGAKGADPLTASGRDLAYAVLFWLQGLGDFRAVQAASQKYEANRIS
jgi:hypothetical protein